VAWKFTRGLPYVASPLFYDGRIYFIKTGGMLSSVDAKSGNPYYVQERLDAPGDYYSSPVAGGGRIYLASLAGKLTVVKAGGEKPEILHQADGDVLQVDILAVEPGAYGWTGLIPGFGLLADQFPDPWLHIWELDGPAARFTDGISVPVQPFCGVLGVAPEEPGLHTVIPPRRVGGNLDTRQLGPGATLYLPVEVGGALFGVGDTHAAQGDGEVCGTAIEAAMTVSLRLSVRRDLAIDTPEFDVTRPLERPSAAAAGYHAATGIGPDLMGAARQSVERMIVHLVDRHGLSSEQAYVLCSVAVDLRISEIVDAPNWVVSAFLPRDLFAAP
jgi:acetamidase/formamidase